MYQPLVPTKLKRLVAGGWVRPTMMQKNSPSTATICTQFAIPNHVAMLQDTDRVAYYKEALVWERPLSFQETCETQQQQQQQQQHSGGLSQVAGLRVLEVGCGPLALLSLLALQQGAAQVDALELNPTVHQFASTFTHQIGIGAAVSHRRVEREKQSQQQQRLRIFRCYSKLFPLSPKPAAASGSTARAVDPLSVAICAEADSSARQGLELVCHDPSPETAAQTAHFSDAAVVALAALHAPDATEAGHSKATVVTASKSGFDTRVEPRLTDSASTASIEAVDHASNEAVLVSADAAATQSLEVCCSAHPSSISPDAALSGAQMASLKSYSLPAAAESHCLEASVEVPSFCAKPSRSVHRSSRDQGTCSRGAKCRKNQQQRQPRFQRKQHRGCCYDLILHEILGDFASQEGAADVIRDIQSRTNSIPKSIPFAARTFIGVSELPSPCCVKYPASEHAERSVLSPRSRLLQSVGLRFSQALLSSQLQAMEELHFEASMDSQMLQRRELEFTVERDGFFAGLLAAIEIEIRPGLFFGPVYEGQCDSWYTNMVLLGRDIRVSKGDTIRVFTEANLTNFQREMHMARLSNLFAEFWVLCSVLRQRR
ncbi:hypothetical protein Esti_004589 [Eimeria stiedai]